MTEEEAGSVARKKLNMRNSCQQFLFLVPWPRGRSRWRLVGQLAMRIKRLHFRLSKPNLFVMGKFCVFFSLLIIYSIHIGTKLHFYTDFKCRGPDQYIEEGHT